MLLAWLPASPARQRWLRRTTVTLVTLLFTMTSPLTAHLLVATLEGLDQPAPHPSPTAADTIVVQGEGLRSSGTLRPRIGLTEDSMRQTACGADLYRQGIAPSLLMAGGDGLVCGSGRTEAAVMNEWAMRLGVPSESISTEK